VLLTFSIACAFAGVLFSSLSFCVLSVALISSFVYARLRFVAEIDRTNLEIDRKILDDLVFAGMPVGVKVDVLNKDPITVRGTFQDMLPKNCVLASGTNTTTQELPPRTIMEMSYSIIPQKRGPQRFPGMKIDRVDALGLFAEDQTIEQVTNITAHTKKESIDTARKLAGREHLEFSGITRNLAVVLRELEFDGIREYVPGDRARDIHWKLWPKFGKLMTKTYRKEGSVQTMVLVDCGRSMRLQSYKIAKIDHALDLSLQISNVLLSSFHPAGVAAFDELRVTTKVPPGLGKHQFDKIVKALRDVPGAFVQEGTPSQNETTVRKAPEPLTKTERNSSGSSEFLSALDKLSARGKEKGRGFGLESVVNETIARGRGQQQLFIVVTDLISSRDAVLAGAKTCQSTGNRMLVIHTYDEWYCRPQESVQASDIERMYGDLTGTLKVEAAFRGAGASYIRIGPADTSARIIRAIRRGKT
jgi:uncharacterized protein (DUF58 family)